MYKQKYLKYKEKYLKLKQLEGGEIKEFQKKEGKYFNYIKALSIFNDCDVVGDGIGSPVGSSSDAQDYFLTVKIDTTCSTPS